MVSNLGGGFILGGNVTKRGELPYQAALGYRGKKGKGNSYNCGGTLINRYNSNQITEYQLKYLPTYVNIEINKILKVDRTEGASAQFPIWICNYLKFRQFRKRFLGTGKSVSETLTVTHNMTTDCSENCKFRTFCVQKLF